MNGAMTKTKTTPMSIMSTTTTTTTSTCSPVFEKETTTTTTTVTKRSLKYKKRKVKDEEMISRRHKMTFVDLLSMLAAKKKITATNVYVSHPGRHRTVLFTCVLFATLTFASSPVGASIDCFKCVSSNGNNPACEDPFHNNFSSSILETPCMGGRKGRNGLFPATACIKMTGRYWDDGGTFIIRGCALDSGTQTTDTEIIRMSHCGGYYYNDRYVRGCLQSCDDADGCNGGPRGALLSIAMNFITLSQFSCTIVLWYFMTQVF